LTRVENKDKYLLLVFALMIVGSGMDIYTDLGHSISFRHVIEEALLFGLSLVALLWLLKDIKHQQKEIDNLTQALEDAKQQVRNRPPEPYVLAARKRLADVISQQFTQWALSPSEKEVGIMLIKGLSLKEIAALRNTLEKTVRQQASSIYKKADINGRHAFSAWFIEDIL